MYREEVKNITVEKSYEMMAKRKYNLIACSNCQVRIFSGSTLRCFHVSDFICHGIRELAQILFNVFAR